MRRPNEWHTLCNLTFVQCSVLGKRHRFSQGDESVTDKAPRRAWIRRRHSLQGASKEKGRSLAASRRISESLQCWRNKEKKKKKETAKYFALIWRGRGSKHFSVLSLLLLPARHAHHTRSSAIGKLREAETAPSNHQHLLTQACRVSSAKKAAREEHVTMKWKLICCNVIFYQKKITEQGPSFGTITQKPLCWQPWQSAGLHGLPYGDTCHAKCWLELKWKRHPACIALPLILTPNILCWQWAFAGGAWRDTFCFCLFVCSSAIIEAYVVLNRRITMNYKLLCISDRRQDLCTATHGTLRAQLHKILPRLCLQEIFAATWRNITVSLVKYLMQVPANQVPALRCYWLNHNCVHTWCSQKQHG